MITSAIRRPPGYLLNQVRKRIYYVTNPGVPWIVPGATQFLARGLRPDWLVFEFGSGRSTVWFARRVARVISIEHDTGWYERVSLLIRQEGMAARVDLRYVPLNHPTDEPTGANYDPLPDYVASAKTVADGSVDICLIDGHYRHACLLAIVPKLKPGGLLVIDNSNWVPKGGWEVPGTWPEVGCFGFAGDETTIWCKPRQLDLPTND